MPPASTISTTSMVFASVTRFPSMKVDWMPIWSRTELICGPPPWTTTTWMPMYWNRMICRAKSFLSSGSTMACPPYFTTILLPRKSLI